MLVVRESRAQAAFRFIGFLAFVAVCVGILMSARLASMEPYRAAISAVISWIGALFFGVMAVRYAWTLLSPGTLTISSEGIAQDLGWRSRKWRWSEIDRVELLKVAANPVSACMLYPVAERPVQLFGWQLSPDELYQTIQRDRATYSNSTIT